MATILVVDDAIMTAIAGGAVEFVAKPYTRERVTAAIESLLAA